MKHISYNEKTQACQNKLNVRNCVTLTVKKRYGLKKTESQNEQGRKRLRYAVRGEKVKILVKERESDGEREREREND